MPVATLAGGGLQTCSTLTVRLQDLTLRESIDMQCVPPEAPSQGSTVLKEASVVLSVEPHPGVLSCHIMLSSRQIRLTFCRFWWEVRLRRASSLQAGCWAQRPGSLWTGKLALLPAALSLAPLTSRPRCAC